MTRAATQADERDGACIAHAHGERGSKLNSSAFFAARHSTGANVAGSFWTTCAARRCWANPER